MAAPTDHCATEYGLPRRRAPAARRIPSRTRRRPAWPPHGPRPAGKARRWCRPALLSPARPENRIAPAAPPAPRRVRRQPQRPRPPRLRRRPAHRRKWWLHAFGEPPWLLFLPPHVAAVVAEVFPLGPCVQPHHHFMCPAHHWPAPVRRRAPLRTPPRNEIELLHRSLAQRGRAVVGRLEQILVGRQSAFPHGHLGQ